MKNFIQTGANVTLPAPYALASGQGALIGSLFGVANGAAAINADAVLSLTGVFDLPKVAIDVIAVGAVLYWDDSPGIVTVTPTGNTKIGVAMLAAANPSGTARVRLNGAF